MRERHRRGWSAAVLGLTLAGATLAAVPAVAGAECEGRAATIVGTAGDDILIGTNRADVIVGKGGNDHIEGLGGRDVICGGAGDDTILGGDAADHLYGQSGADTLQGGDGNDRLFGGSGSDVLTGRDGRDYLYGEEGDDKLDGGRDDDRLSGGTGRDVVGGGPGDDLLMGDDGDDRLTGGGGNDQLWGGEGDNRLLGNSGDDLLTGGPGRDRLDGGTGADVLSGGDGKDTARGGPGNDELIGEGGDDRLDGGSGDDEISGSEGDDYLIGGRGRDICRGDEGIDEAASCETPESTEIGDRPPIITRPSANAVALTFDDGPSPVYTPIVLDILARYDVKATFFVTGSSAKRNPALIRRMIEEGHSVQNHTCGHAWLTRYDNRGVIEQIECHNDIIEDITGIRPRCVRPPFGAINDRVRSLIGSLGMKTVMWDVDPWDFQRPGSSITAARVLRATGPGDVVLLHDTAGHSTYNALHTIIPALQKRGYAFESICG